jgi:hypothetical protein
MDPNATIGAILLGTLSIAAMHALIPSHWLAFAVVGRAQRWTMRHTLFVTALAGSGHILITVVLGLLLAVVGKQLHRAIPPQLEHAATAGLLILLGLYFALPSLRGQGHPHGHAPAHDHTERGSDTSSDLARRLGASPTIMGVLVLGMTLSPCLDLLSLYLAASALSWRVLIAISGLLAVTTLSLMLALVWLTLHGLQRLRLDWLDRHEGLVVGALLILLGVLLFFLG